MSRPLRIPNSAKVSIKEIKIVSRISSNETATRCNGILNKEKILERLERPILDFIDHLIRFRKPHISEHSSDKRSMQPGCYLTPQEYQHIGRQTFQKTGPTRRFE